MQWQFSNEMPIYSQLVEQIKIGIVSGMFPPGERLPSVRDLATEAGVNPNTTLRTKWFVLKCDIKVKREVLKLAQLMLGLFCCSKTISYQ